MNVNKILSLAKQNGGYITGKQVKGIGLSTRYLTDLIEDGKIEKVKPGLYLETSHMPDEFFEVLYNTAGIFSHATALYFHKLADRTPVKFDITVPGHYNGSLQNNKKVNLFYVKKEFYALGLTETKSSLGLSVKVYDAERTICDIMRNEKKMETEIFVSALQHYAKSKSKKLNVLLKYASLLGVSDKIEEKLRILL